MFCSNITGMNESYKNPGCIDGEQLMNDVRTAREASIESMQKNDIWCSTVSKWDADFKIRLNDLYGSTRFAQQVPAWQVLIGGTIEAETDITQEQKEFILKEVTSIYQKLMQMLDD